MNKKVTSTIKITYHNQPHLNDLIEITSDDLCLCFVNFHHIGGLQSSFEGDSSEYEKQLQLLYNIADDVRELIKIQNKFIESEENLKANECTNN